MVVIVGSAAHGVFHIAGTAFGVLEVVVPVDGISADTTYSEPETAWLWPRYPYSAAM